MFKKHKQMSSVICMKPQFDMTLTFIEALKYTINNLCFILVILLPAHRLQGQNITLLSVL